MKSKICRSGLLMFITTAIYYIAAIRSYLVNGEMDYSFLILGSMMLVSGCVSAVRYKNAKKEIEG